MNTILIPILLDSQTEKIKKFVSSFANKEVDKLYFIHVIELGSITGFVDAVEVNHEALFEDKSKKEKGEFNDFVEEVRLMGYLVETAMPLGNFGHEFINLANELNPTLIIMFTGGAETVIEDIFGTNTSTVFDKINSPIMIVPNNSAITHFNKAAVGLNIENGSLNVLKQVFTLADIVGLKLHFVKIEDNFKLVTINDERILAEIEELFPGKVPFIAHREKEDAADGLEEYAFELNVDLIILFTTKRNFLEKLFHRSVSKDLVLHSKKPLLIYHY